MRARAFHDWGAARQVDMVELAHRLGARLKPSGKFRIGACPNGCASSWTASSLILGDIFSIADLPKKAATPSRW